MGQMWRGVLAAIVLMLSAAPGQAETAEILEMFHQPMPQGWVEQPAPTPPPIEQTGWNRPDFLLPLYAGDTEDIPAKGLENIGYFVTFLAHMAEGCGRLDLDVLSFEMLPYIFANGTDVFQRMFEGQLSGPETLMMLASAITTFTEQRECRVPMGLIGVQRDLAQQRCNSARDGLNALGVIMNQPAANDAKRFLARHSCKSPQTLWMEERLAHFARNAHRLVSRPASVPGLETAEGRVYNEILGNCLRSGWGEADTNYCQCYAAQLYRADPPRDLLNRLARDPFLTARTWRDPVLAGVADTSGFQTCLDPPGDTPREYRAPRPTACLIDEAREDGMNACTYRAAWGVFRHVTPDACQPEISSRRWGSDVGEVDCGAAKPVALTVPDGPVPRIWTEGKAQMVDFEQDVPEDFAPRLRDLVDDLIVPTYVRFLKREGRGQLRSMSYQPFQLMMVANVGMGRAMQHRDTDVLLWRSGMMLNCSYRSDPGLVRMRSYWFEQVPDVAGDPGIAPELRPYIDAMSPARETCPPVME